MRREATSTKLSLALREIRILSLYSELADIRYGKTDAGAPAGTGGSHSGSTPAQSTGNSASAAETIQVPAGTTIPVTNRGLIDSTFVPEHATLLAAMDADAKGPDGKVLIPADASVTLEVRERRVVDGRISMQFELSTVDFGNRHYIVSSAKGESEPGPVLTMMGAEPRTPDAKLRGPNLHVDDHSLMLFKSYDPHFTC